MGKDKIEMEDEELGKGRRVGMEGIERMQKELEGQRKGC